MSVDPESLQDTCSDKTKSSFSFGTDAAFSLNVRNILLAAYRLLESDQPGAKGKNWGPAWSRRLRPAYPISYLIIWFQKIKIFFYGEIALSLAAGMNIAFTNMSTDDVGSQLTAKEKIPCAFLHCSSSCSPPRRFWPAPRTPLPPA